jgi:hypothetical protein
LSLCFPAAPGSRLFGYFDFAILPVKKDCSFPCMSVASTARDLGLDYDRTFWLTCCCTHAIFATVFHQRELIRQRHGIIGSGNALSIIVNILERMKV